MAKKDTKNNMLTKNEKGDIRGYILRSINSLRNFAEKKSGSVSLIDLTKEEYPDGGAIIHNRGKELKEIFNVIGKARKRNVIILGEAGTGRRQLIEGLAQSIKEGRCPKKFAESLFFEVPLEQFLPEINNKDEIGERIIQLVKIALNFPNTIFYIKDIEELVDHKILELFKLIFENAICIGILDDTETYSHFNDYYFVGITAIKPEKKDIYNLVKGSLREIQDFHKVAISKESFELILNEALTVTCKTNISDVLDIADEAASIAESRGIRYLGIKSVLETNRRNINAMLEYSKEKRALFAIHEAGHAMVALHHNIGIDAINIIPNDDGVTGGFNLFEVNKNSLSTKKEIFQNIEIGLGGYAGTLIKGYPLTYLAVEDLLEVNKIERAMFLYLGMEKDKPISYLNSYGELELTYMSNEMKNELDRKINTNILIRLENAKKIISENEEKFNLISLALQKKGFLTQKEILLLYNGEISLKDIADIRSLIFND